LQLRLSGSYAFSKASRVTLGYLYQRLKSDDPYYNAYQYGYTPTSVLATNQRTPTYRAQAVYVVYRYSFQ
jgi:hypothetical protein